MRYSDILIHAVQRLQGASDGRWAAIEVKVGEDKVEDAIKTLSHLEKKVCSSPRAKVRPITQITRLDTSRPGRNDFAPFEIGEHII